MSMHFRPMTRDEVFSLFLRYHRRALIRGEVDERLVVTQRTNLGDWLAGSIYYDVMSHRQIGLGLNLIFEIDVSRPEWCSLFDRPEATLGDLCEFVASRSRVPAIEPMRILGRS